MPRIAWKATGRPITLSCATPHASVQADRQLEGLVARRLAHLLGEPADRIGRNAGDLRGPLGRAVPHALHDRLERGLHGLAVGHAVFAQQLRLGARGVAQHLALRGAVPPHLVLRVERVRLPLVVDVLGIQHGKAVARARRVHVEQVAGVGVAREEVAVVQARCDELAGDGEHQRAVGAGADRDPLVGDGGVAGAHGVDRDEPPARALELRDRDLERVASGGPRPCRSSRRASRGRGRGRRTPRRSRRWCRSCPRPCSPSRSRRGPRSWACRTAARKGPSTPASGRAR